MKKNLSKLIIFLFVLCILFLLYRKSSSHNEEVCATYSLAIKGVVKGEGGHGIYTWVEVDNLKTSITINISKEIYKVGFPSWYTYDIGDSIIKKANSKEFTIKHGKKKAIYILDCRSE